MPKILSEQQGGSAGSPHSDDGFQPTSSERANDLFREMNIVWLVSNFIEATPRPVRLAIKKHVDVVVEAIKKFGFRVPILVKRTGPDGTYEVIDGHTRLEAARQLDALEVPCIIVDDLSDVDVRRLRLSLNKLQETGFWDNDVLRLEINEIIEIDGDFEFPGFELAEIEALRFGRDAQCPAIHGSAVYLRWASGQRGCGSSWVRHLKLSKY